MVDLLVLDNNSVQPGNEEDADDDGPSGTNTDDQTNSLGISEVDLDLTTLPDNQHGKERGGNAEVDGDKSKTLHDGVASQHDSVLGNEEDDGSKATSKTGGDNPGKEHRDDTGADALVELGPVDTVGADESNTHSDDTTHDGVGGGDRKTNPGADGKVDGGSNDSAHHAEHEKGRIALKQVNIDDLGSDSIGDSGTDTDSSGEFKDGTQSHGLDVGDGSGRNRCGPRVGDIVGTLGYRVSVWRAVVSGEYLPMFHASRKAKMVPMAKIQSY